MIVNSLERFQAFLDPLYGSLSLEAYWVKVASDGENPPLVGALEQGVSRSYQSLIAANQAALTFPAFPAIAARFETEPFTAISDLLEALKELQAQEATASTAELEATPFKGAPQEPS